MRREGLGGVKGWSVGVWFGDIGGTREAASSSKLRASRRRNHHIAKLIESRVLISEKGSGLVRGHPQVQGTQGSVERQQSRGPRHVSLATIGIRGFRARMCPQLVSYRYA
jgi:hypothetical protein